MKKKWLYIIGAIIILAILGAIFGPSESEVIEKENTLINKILDEGDFDKAIEKLESYNERDKYYETAQSKLDSVMTLKKEAERKGLIALLKVLKSKLEEGIDYSDNYKSKESLYEVITNFKKRIVIINKGKELNEPELKTMLEELEDLCIKDQVKEFPKLRKAFSEFLKNSLWENDITVKVSGAKNTTLDFTGRNFVLNKNIKDFQEKLSQTFEQFRFQKVNYRWSKRASEFTYYDLNNSKDNELVI